MKKLTFLVITACFFSLILQAQDPNRFEGEIERYRSQALPDSKSQVILFTGSSSVRMWKDLNERFPEHDVINRGFGGSQMSDLLYYMDELILKLKPVKVFIYEGDNDISAGKTSKQILRDAKKIRKRIKKELPGTQVYFIAAKPSIARWELKDQYLDFNAELEAFASGKADTYFIDVWTPMIASDGTVMKDIFINDGLHMNDKGYDIWTRVIAPFLK